MLIFFGIVLAILSVAMAVLIAFANGMSDAPTAAGLSYWPVLVPVALSVVCFVLRHLLSR